MNYLAHIYLSGDDKRVAVGNFIGDGVKGRIRDRYPGPIGVGLKLHRFIDDMADNHPLNLSYRQYLYDDFGKYAGVVQDMMHDHFLSKNWRDFSDIPLPLFLEEFYSVADELIDYFPARQKRFYSAMREGRWLINYAEIDGMDRAFKGISSRVRADNEMHRAADYIKSNYQQLENSFREFFPILIEESKKELERLLKSSK